MALRLIDNSVFIHIPKTGGTWVSKVLEDQNLVKNHKGSKHTTFDLLLLKIVFPTGSAQLPRVIKFNLSYALCKRLKKGATFRTI